MPYEISLKEELSRDALCFLQETGAHSGKYKGELKELVELYLADGPAALTPLLGEEHGRELAALFFEKIRTSRIKRHVPQQLLQLASEPETADSDSLMAEKLFKDIPATLINEPRSNKKTAGLNAFIYRMEHSYSNNTITTVEDKFQDLVDALSSNRVVLLQGDTGCGKTTKIPRMLLSHYDQIACTQPRRLAAISVARKVANDLKAQLGDLVGYSVRFDNNRNNKTRLHFLTDGMLLKELSKKNKKKLKYDLVIIDEAHERNINTDFLLGYFKSFDEDVKVLIMSATLHTEVFIEHFNSPLIELNHRVHPIEHFYLKQPTDDYFATTIETVVRITQEYPTGDILVFLTGQDEIERGYETLSGILKPGITIRKLYSAMNPAEQDKAFLKEKRKVVLSTNIAETSVTIENIKFVVDSGKVKQKRRGLGTSIDFMEVIAVSKAQAKQRAGRAGRTGPGMAFRIYTYSEYKEMAERSTPELLRSCLNSVILALKNLNINDVMNFEYLDKPPEEATIASLQALYYMRAIDDTGTITELGRTLASKPFEPEMALVLHIAKSIGCLDAVSTIAAFLNVGPVFLEPKSKREAKAIKEKFFHPSGDFYTFLLVYNGWKESRFSSRFLNENCLNNTAMEKALQIKMQLMAIERKASISVKKVAQSLPTVRIDSALKDKIMESFCAGYFMNVAKREDTHYRTLFGNIFCDLHFNDPLFKQKPKYVLFYELVCIKKEYMRGCLEIESNVLHMACNRRSE